MWADRSPFPTGSIGKTFPDFIYRYPNTKIEIKKRTNIFLKFILIDILFLRNFIRFSKGIKKEIDHMKKPGSFKWNLFFKKIMENIMAKEKQEYSKSKKYKVCFFFKMILIFSFFDKILGKNNKITIKDKINPKDFVWSNILIRSWNSLECDDPGYRKW